MSKEKEIKKINVTKEHYKSITVNSLAEEISSDEEYRKFLKYCYQNKDFNLLEEYFDNYYDYVCNIIDESDYISLTNGSKVTRELLMNRLRHEDCALTYRIGINTFMTKLTYLFDISKEEDKEFLKKNIKLNTIDPYNNKKTYKLVTRKYVKGQQIEGDPSNYYFDLYTFINKDLDVIAETSSTKPSIRDYREDNTIEKDINKYKSNEDRKEKYEDFNKNRDHIIEMLKNRLKFILN